MSDQWWLCTRRIWLWPMMIMCDTKCCYIKDSILFWPTFTTTNNQNHTNVLTSHSFNQKNKNSVQYQMKIPLPENSSASFLPKVMQILVWKQLWICGAEWNSVQTKSKTFWMGEEVQEIYDNNSILWSSSILYNWIPLISSYFKRLVPIHLTPRQCENSF